jgi:hypothetical protein
MIRPLYSIHLILYSGKKVYGKWVPELRIYTYRRMQIIRYEHDRTGLWERRPEKNRV